MLQFWKNLFAIEPFIPHGHCYLWKPELVWLHIVSDSLIALAYYLIAIALVYFVRKRQDLPFNWIFLLFGTFIAACATTHLIEVWTLWHPTYWFSGLTKAITATVSIYTALELVPLLPLALALPSPTQLEVTNLELLHQIMKRQRAESGLQKALDELETKVRNRTLELALANEELRAEITQRQQAESELAASGERFQATFNQAAVGIAHLDTDGKWLLVNQKLCEIVGYTQSELQSKTFQAITHPDDIDADLEYVRQLLAAQIQTYSMEKRYIRKDGSYIWINLTVTLVREPKGEPKYFIAVVEDITSRKQAQEKQLKTQERLQTLSGKLIEAQEAERRRIACELHDEIGQALTAVKINLQALERSFDKSEMASPLLESINIVEVALSQVRSLSRDLRPSLLDDLGLLAALRWYVARQTQRAGIIGEFVSELIDPKLSPSLETTCFRIVQEALTNVVRHAQAQARVVKEFPNVRVIIVSMHANEEYVLQALRIGAMGYVIKDAGVSELELAVRAVFSGETYLSPAVSKHVVADYVRRVGNESSSLEQLTSRQREILQLIAEGRTTKEIADSLYIGVKTVETHRMQLMKRLDIHDVAGLVRYAIRIGLVLPDT